MTFGANLSHLEHTTDINEQWPGQLSSVKALPTSLTQNEQPAFHCWTQTLLWRFKNMESESLPLNSVTWLSHMLLGVQRCLSQNGTSTHLYTSLKYEWTTENRQNLRIAAHIKDQKRWKKIVRNITIEFKSCSYSHTEKNHFN